LESKFNLDSNPNLDPDYIKKIRVKGKESAKKRKKFGQVWCARSKFWHISQEGGKQCCGGSEYTIYFFSDPALTLTPDPDTNPGCF
jgi:hypothetical protein